MTIFDIEGEINAGTFEQLQAHAQKAFDAGARNLLLDLTDVPFVSSAGIRALNTIFRLFQTDGESNEDIARGLRDGTFKSRHLKLLSPNARVNEVLSMAGVDMFLETHRNLDEALASF
ncbi:MAG: STAS domain-containing protein [Anaerolineales bacterium]